MILVRALVLALAALLLAAGCIGAKKEDGPPAAPVNKTEAHNVTLPDREGVCSGCVETNKTVNSTVDGKDHKHDYWKGRETVTIFQNDVGFFPLPVFPDGEGSQPRSVAYVKLPNSSLVYEGSDSVTLLGQEGSACPVDPAGPCAPNPVPNKFHLEYRSAADAAWRDAGELASGTPLKITVLPKESDMPHSVLSLWVFRITTENPSITTLNLTITTHKGRDVVNWPGHPDFYADGDVRVVAMNKHVKTHMSGIAESFLYDQGGTWAAPDKLISYGTGKLLVFINVTSFSTQTGQPPTGFFLEVHNATIIGPEVTFGARYHDKDKKNDLKSYVFEVPVDGAGMDGPYQPASRWGFRTMATYAEIPVADIGLCPGCFAYDIEYDLTVLAIHTQDASGMVM